MYVLYTVRHSSVKKKFFLKFPEFLSNDTKMGTNEPDLRIFLLMPWYRISYTSSKGRLVSGFKEFHIKNVDDAYLFFRDKVKAADPDFTGFSCVMVSTKSEEWQEWDRKRAVKRFGPTVHRSGPGKYRNRKDG